MAHLVGTSSWKEQFIDAITIGGDDDEDEDEDDDEESGEKIPSFIAYIMHFLTVFWKVLFALIPPTGNFII